MGGAFIDEAFPIDLAYGSSGGPTFSTTITETAGGFEQRNANWSQARIKMDASTGVQEQSDLARLIAHFRACAGRWAGFRCRDWSDFTTAPDGVSDPEATDVLLGTGDGTAKTFQLIKVYAAGHLVHTRRITRPCEGTVLLAVNGVEALGWTVDHATGVVAFASAPAPGARITGGFEYDVPCRYDTDTLSEKLEDYQAGSATVPIVELRE
ncbi:DUF2460 domain-containing protein (plasmid) [Roseomonas mucosa]|uniref:DUF2460 domain-containing protein n=1 Tax=Roseomonas mucosa TaxID=207340 RepID=UPI0030CCB6E8